VQHFPKRNLRSTSVIDPVSANSIASTRRTGRCRSGRRHRISSCLPPKGNAELLRCDCDDVSFNLKKKS